MNVKIYALKDNTGIRYVGKTVQPLALRLRDHVNKAARKQRTKKDLWLMALLQRDQSPSIQLLQIVDRDSAGAMEAQWMAHFEQRGCALVNSAPAGAGGTFRRQVDWARYENQLGVIPDKALAKRIGVTRKAVSYQREKRGIVPCGNREELRSPPPNRGGWNAITLDKTVIALLGTMPDADLAKQAGVSKKRIMTARHKRSIPSWAEQNGNPTRYHNGNYPKRWINGD